MSRAHGDELDAQQVLGTGTKESGVVELAAPYQRYKRVRVARGASGAPGLAQPEAGGSSIFELI